MKMNTIALVLLVLFTVNACVFHGGNPKHINTTTVGQELIDLQLALEKGAITEAEYQAIKATILDSNHKKTYIEINK